MDPDVGDLLGHHVFQFQLRYEVDVVVHRFEVPAGITVLVGVPVAVVVGPPVGRGLRVSTGR